MVTSWSCTEKISLQLALYLLWMYSCTSSHCLQLDRIICNFGGPRESMRVLLKAGLWCPFSNSFYQGMWIVRLCNGLTSSGSHSCSDFEMHWQYHTLYIMLHQTLLSDGATRSWAYCNCPALWKTIILYFSSSEKIQVSVFTPMWSLFIYLCWIFEGTMYYIYWGKGSEMRLA